MTRPLLQRSGSPGHPEIVYEINRRFLDNVRTCFPEDKARVVRSRPDRGNTP